MCFKYVFVVVCIVAEMALGYPLSYAPAFAPAFGAPAFAAPALAAPALAAPALAAQAFAAPAFAAPGLAAPWLPAASTVAVREDVSHSLANVLQMMVVGNLLENTLPLNSLNGCNLNRYVSAAPLVGAGPYIY